MCSAAHEAGFDQQLWDTSKVVFQDTRGSYRETYFFRYADGKAEVLMANCTNLKAGAPQAMVCWLRGCNRAQSLANLELEDTIDGCWYVVLPIGAIYRHIAIDRRNHDYGWHGVLPFTKCGIWGMHNATAASTGKSAAVVVRN